ncbi:MAG: polysaccharide biosynthesis protein [Kiritimatiellaeota bacterium]|nr:polysaccharide biosynthesis protein [Kiritimatiellota bacterium]
MPNNEETTSLIVELNHYLEKMVDMLVPIRTFLVFASSFVTVVFSFLLAFYFRFDFSFSAEETSFIPTVLLLVIVVKMTSFYFFRLYEGMWRYVSITDILKIFISNLIASAVLIISLYLLRARFAPGFSLNVLVIDFLICFLVMSGKRMLTRVIRESAARVAGKHEIRSIILGDTESTNSLIQALNSAPSNRDIIGILSDDIKIGHSLRGVTVLGRTSSAAKVAKKHNASEILILPPFSTPSTLKTILEDLEQREKKCDLRMVPSYADIADGKISVSNIKEVEIEDLLGRKPVKLDRTDVARFAENKTIMVTGAGGSIGSELCHQIASYSPTKLVLFELSEFNLYTISGKLARNHPDVSVVSVIGDIRDAAGLDEAMKNNGVDTIFHAAAYKHVPLMELNPKMAVRTNILGTANLADVAERRGIERVVIISTDKAVNPTSVMGASKRVAERIVLERPSNKTEFVVVRFGNVLGSSGSVIPRFREQLKDGGPLTVTSENVVRYFMSIPEAVDLLLQAAAIGSDRDIMVLEMGEQIKIYDMARKLIELSGLKPDEDIEIKIIGLRPGEKEYEEILTDEEMVDKTSAERVYVAKKRGTTPPPVVLEKLRGFRGNIAELRAIFAEFIPENKFDEAAK